MKDATSATPGKAPSRRHKPRILVVDDEPEVTDLIAYNLKGAGYETVTAEDGGSAIKIARRDQPDLIILDLMLPEMDGLEVCKIIRRDPALNQVPILMLTAKATELDRVLGLELGANDYVTKPFSMRELVLRVKNLLARPGGSARAQPEVYRAGDLELDIPRHLLTVDGFQVDLTATEFRLLTVLLERRGRVQSREQLLQDVWNYESLIDTRTVDTHMRRLRQKLGRSGELIETVRGVGYRFLSEAART